MPAFVKSEEGIIARKSTKISYTNVACLRAAWIARAPVPAHCCRWCCSPPSWAWAA